MGRLINIPKYKRFCLDNRLVTNSALYFKTSAEVVYQYLNKDLGFEEEHTALSDSEIETFILAKCLKKGKVQPSIKDFPFQILGTTYDYVMAQKKKTYVETLLEMISNYIDSKGESVDLNVPYWIRMVNMENKLKEVLEI